MVTLVGPKISQVLLKCQSIYARYKKFACYVGIMLDAAFSILYYAQNYASTIGSSRPFRGTFLGAIVSMLIPIIKLMMLEC